MSARATMRRMVLVQGKSGSPVATYRVLPASNQRTIA